MHLRLLENGIIRAMLAASRISLWLAQPRSFANFNSTISVLLPKNTVAPLLGSTSSSVVELIAIDVLYQGEQQHGAVGGGHSLASCARPVVIVCKREL